MRGTGAGPGAAKVFAEAGHSDVIITRSPGYLLDLSAVEIDARRFDEIVAEGRALAEAGRSADAADALRSALRLWRGAALEEVPGRVVRATRPSWRSAA